MPKGPRGEKRPADAIGAAVTVGRIATGELKNTRTDETPAVKMGRNGGVARAKRLSKDERKKIAKKAAIARWNKR